MKNDRNLSRKHAGMTRREVLLLGGLGVGIGAGAGVLAFNNQEIMQFVTGSALMAGPPPSFPRAARTGKVREYTLEVAPVNLMVGGKRVSTWAYNGMVPGPEIRATEGDTVRVTVKNRLPQGTTVHWHGVPLVNAMDGVPDITQPAIKPGQDFTYEFLAPAAGTFMYHSHVGLQQDHALYGPLIIDATKETIKYDHDFVLVLDDWLDGFPPCSMGWWSYSRPAWRR
jgi:FtsP/CotA-like multicopper oxidase with cupredoxin domain